MDKKILMDILDGKEKRSNMQKDLIKEYGHSLISFTLNIPGIIKTSSLYTDIHIEGMRIICKELNAGNIPIIYTEEIERISGREGYIVIDSAAKLVKKLTIDIEDRNRLGRVFDIDVFDKKNIQVSRKDLEDMPRKCLLCNKNVLTCMREKNHNYDELIDEIENIWKNYNKK